MGAVYQATDTRLGLEVALKVLPHQFIHDRQRMGRFQREAKVLASLNHPNISTIHGLEESGEVHALVLELVEGPTLAEMIAQGPIPVDEALPMALEIAQALEAAHEKGIIHRDLKPANVKITSGGMIKVLDFGLAKALEPELTQQELANSPTLTLEATQEGMVLGTPAYMSPEQARGKPVDRRTDIWAFGCVLLECLTGEQEFGGETLSDSIAKIIQKEPDWEALPERTPRGIRRLLHRCLEKDPHDRLHHIADARIEIRHALEQPSPDPYGEGETPSPAWWQRPIPLAVLGLLIVLLGGLLGAFLWKPDSLTGPRLSVVPPEGVSLPQRYITLSPDGRRLVYAASRGGTVQLYVRDLFGSSWESRAIPHTEGSFYPFFSPDGKWIGFFDFDVLKKVSLTGEMPQTLSEANGGWGGSWGQDGTIIFQQIRKGLWRVSETGGTPEALTKAAELREGSLGDRYPQILPGGKAVLFNRYAEGVFSIGVVSPETGEERIFAKKAAHPRYAATGHLIHANLDGKLLAAPFDLETLDVTEPFIQVLDQVWKWQYALSENGTLAYVPEPEKGRNTLVWVDRQGEQQPVTSERGDFQTVRFSPDGKRLALSVRSGTGTDRDIWTYEIARDILSPLTTEGGDYPVWNPNGSRVAFASDTQGGDHRMGGSLFWIPADGSGEARRLTTRGLQVPHSWSPDGNFLVFTQNHTPVNNDISVLPAFLSCSMTFS